MIEDIFGILNPKGIGSEEWKRERKNGIGGSEIASIMGIEGAFQTPWAIWASKTGAKELPDIGGNFAVQKGVQFEIVARAKIEEQMECSFEPKSWVHKDYPICRATDDGYNEERNIILEVKYMGQQPHEAASRGIIPDKYKAQMLWNLQVSGADHCLFISYNPDSPGNEMVIIKVGRNDTIGDITGESMIEFGKLWWETHVVLGLPPDITSKDFQPIETQEWKDLAYQFIKCKNAVDSAEKELDVAKKNIRDVLDSSGVPALKGFGISAKESLRKGAVDYGKIKELSSVDLEKYRKKSITVFSVLECKE